MILFALLLIAFWRWLDKSRPLVQLHPQLGQIASDIGRFARVRLGFGTTHLAARATEKSFGSILVHGSTCQQSTIQMIISLSTLVG